MNQSTLPLKDSDTILHRCSSLLQFLDIKSQFSHKIQAYVVHVYIFFFFLTYVLLYNWEEKCFYICAVVYFPVFYEGREQSQFCLPLVEKCLVLWQWVEITEGLLWVFECDMRKI